MATKCSMVPIVGENGLESKVFNTVLNFKNTIGKETIANMSLEGVKSIRDLAIYVFGISKSLAESNSSMIANDGTGEIPVSSVLLYLASNEGISENARKTFRNMFEELSKEVSTEYNDVIEYNGKYTPSQQNYFNLVLGRAYLQVLSKYRANPNKTTLSLKREIVNQLRQNIIDEKLKQGGIADPIKDLAVDNFFIEIFNSNSGLWSSFLTYLNNTYGTKFRDSEISLKLENDEINTDTTEGVEDLWDPASQAKVNRLNTVAYIVKQRIAEMLTDFDNVHSSNDFLYLQQPQDINTLWNRLISLHLSDVTKENVLSSLRSIVDQYPTVGKIIEQFEQSEGETANPDAVDFVNAYMATVKMAVIPANIVSLDPSFNLQEFTNNKAAFAQDVVTDKYIATITSGISSGLYSADRLVEWGNKFKGYKEVNNTIYNQLNTPTGLDTICDEFVSAFAYIGLDINNVVLKRYITSQGGDVRATLANVATSMYYILRNVYSSVAKGVEFSSTEYNRINELAAIGAKDFNVPTSLSYLGVNGELRYSPQFDSFITKLFRGLVRDSKVNRTYLEHVFAPYLQDQRLNNPQAPNNLLIYDSETGIGMFERKSDVEEGEFPYKLNNEFYNNLVNGLELNISQFEGVVMNGVGTDYASIQSAMYNLTEMMYALQGRHIILTSDSPRSYAIRTKAVKTGDVINNDGTVNTESAIVKALSKIINQEIYDFNTAGREIFKESNENIHKYHNLKYSNGKTFLDADGVPTGKAFKFLNVTYKENGKEVTLIDYVAKQLGITPTEVYQRLVKQLTDSTYTNPEFSINLNNYVSGFITSYIEWTWKNIDNLYGNLKNTIENILENETNRNSIYERYGISPKENVNTTNEVLLGAVLNHTVYSVIFDDLVSGNITEYKNTVDSNKRSNAPIKNGTNAVDTTSIRRILLINDANYKTNMTELLFTEDTSDSSKISNSQIRRAYQSLITYNDAQSIMTDVAAEKFLKAVGRWNEYKDMFEQLRDPSKPFDPRMFTRLNESLKTFAYTRAPRGQFHKSDVSDYFNSQMESVQVKDSTIVIFSATAVGSLKNMYDYMIKNDIGQISPVSAVKVSGVTAANILTDNRELQFPENVEDHVITLHDADFVIQQDIKPAIVDEHIIVGNQFLKQIIQGLNMTKAIYNFNGKKITGKELSSIFQKTLYTNIKEDSMNLLYDLGAIDDDGNLRLDEQGNITISYTKFVKQLQEVVEDDSASIAIKEAIRTDDKGMPTLSLSYPVVYAKFEHIILSKITKKVLNQKLLGFHIPIVSDTFNIPLGTNELAHKIAVAVKEGKDTTALIEEYNKKIDALVQNGIVTYSDDFIKNCKAEHRSLELRSEYKYDENGQLVHYAEVIANPFSLELFNTIGIDKEVTYTDENGVKQTKVFKSVDINAIPKEARELIGIRIPTEGKQSMVLFEIVGFLNTGSSQAIFPAQLIKRTGWDFDIDSVYAYRRAISYQQGNYSVEKFEGNSEALNGQSGRNFVDNVLRQKYRQILSAEVLNDPRTNAVEGSQIRGVLRGPKFTVVINGLYNLFNERSNVQKVITNNIATAQDLIDNIWNYTVDNESSNIDGKVKDALTNIKSFLNGSIPNAVNVLKHLVQEYYEYTVELYNSKKYAEAALGRPLTQDEVYGLSSKVGGNFANKGAIFAEATLINISDKISSLQKYIDKVSSLVEELSNNEELQIGNLLTSLKSTIETLSTGLVEVDIQGERRQANIFKLNTDCLNTAKELFKQYKRNFKYNEDIYEKNSREARDNQLIDVAFSILGNAEHAVQLNKPNESDHINACSTRDNGLWGIQFAGLNAHNMHDKMLLANMAMGSRILKGHSVNFDGFLSITGNLGAYSEQSVRRVVDVQDLPLFKNNKGEYVSPVDKNGDIIKEYAEFLDKRCGHKSWKHIKDRNVIEFSDKYFNGDASGENLDISGEDISLQINETTTAILDSVKSPLMFNLTTETLTLFRLLSAGVVTERFYDPNDESNRDVNRYSYASAFIQQPAISKIIELYNESVATTGNANMQAAIGRARNYYTRRLWDSFTEGEKDIIFDKIPALKELGSKGKVFSLSKSYINNIIEALNIQVPASYAREDISLFTTRELLSIIQNRNNVSQINTILSLEVLGLFEHYYNQARSISNLIFTLKTESKISSFAKLDIEELTKANYYIDKYTFNGEIGEASRSSYVSIDSFISENADIAAEIEYDSKYLYGEEFKAKYPDIPHKTVILQRDVTKALSLFNETKTVAERKELLNIYKLDYKPNFDIRVGNKSIVDAIFVTDTDSYIDVENAKFKDLKNESAYPFILARYQFGRMFGATGFGKTFAQRSNAVKTAIHKFASRSGVRLNEQIRTKISNQLINYAIQSGLNGQTPVMQDVSSKTMKTILGLHGEDHSAIIKKYTDNIKDKLSPEEFEDYTKLSIAEQILVIQSNPTLIEYINKPDFRGANIFKYIKALTKNSSGNKKGLDLISIIRDDDKSVVTDSLVASVRSMWDSPNPYIAHTIRSLIAYTYITESFTYGNNIARYIPIEIITELLPNESYEKYIRAIGYNDPTTNIPLYATDLAIAEQMLINDEMGSLDEAFEFIGRQLPSINPSTSRLNTDIPYRDFSFVSSNNRTIKGFFETDITLEQAGLSEVPFVIERTENGTTLYKKYELDNPLIFAGDYLSNQKIYVFLPVGKLLTNEFSNESIVDGYNVDNKILLEDGSSIDLLVYLKTSPEFSAYVNTMRYTDIAGDPYKSIRPSEQSYREDNTGFSDETEFEETDSPIEEDTSIQNAYGNESNQNDTLHSVDIPIEVKEAKQSVTESVRDLTDKASTIIYIGNEQNLRHNIYKQSGKLITVDYTNNPTKEAERIVKSINKGILHIDGDSNITSYLGEKAGYIWTNMFVNRLYELTGNIESIQTFVTDGVSKYVAATSLGNITESYVPAGKENILHSVNINIQDSDSTGFNAKLYANAEIAIKALESTKRIILNAKYHNTPGIEDIKNPYNAIAKEGYGNELEELLRNKDVDATDYVFTTLSKIYGGVLESSRYILSELNKTNVYSLGNDYNKYQSYKERLVLGLQLCATINKFDSIRTITMEELGLDENNPDDVEQFNQQFATINTQLREIQDIYARSREINASFISLADKVLVNNVIKYSRNPKYASAFKKILERVRETSIEDIKDISFGDLEISDEERRDILIKVTNYVNGDISSWQLKLDSAFVTTDTSVDITGKSYADAKYASEKQIRAVTDALEDALTELDPALAKHNAGAKRAAYFKRFVTEYGDLISTYKESEIEEELSILRDKLFNTRYNMLDSRTTFDTTATIRELSRSVDAIIEDANNNNLFTVEMISEDEQNIIFNELEKMSDVERTAYLKRNNLVELHSIRRLEDGATVNLYRIDYKEEAHNPEYNKLSDKDKIFLDKLKDIIKGVLKDYNPNYITSSNSDITLFPYLKEGTIKDTLKNIVAIPGRKIDKFYTSIGGDKIYLIEPSTLSVPTHYYRFEIPRRNTGERYSDYTERIVKTFEEWYNKDSDRKLKVAAVPKTVKAVYDYIKQVNLENKKYSTKTRSYDISAVIKSFARDLYDTKIIRDYTTSWQLMRSTMLGHGADIHAQNLIKALDNQMKRVANASKNTNALDTAASIVLKATSRVYMYGNVTAGIKNIIGGITNMIIESTPNGMITKSEVRKGIGKMLTLSHKWIANANRERVDNLDIAILKDFDTIYQDTRDSFVASSGIGFIAKSLSNIDTMGYAANNIGEWIMQFGMLFACARSFRVVGNRAMSFIQFYNDNKNRAVQDIFTDEQRSAFYKWKNKKDEDIKKYESRKNKKYLWTGDYVGEFLRLNHDMFTSDQIKQFRELQKDNRKSERAKFESFPTLYDCFELKDGRLGFKEGYELSDEYMTEFRETVKAINQSLHGIYNRIDRMALQDSMLGELFTQFRKWMRPAWNRYFGRRFMKPTFNEITGTLEVPVYYPMYKFLSSGYTKYKSTHGKVDRSDLFKAIKEILKYQLQTLAQARFFYDTLSIEEKAAFDKWVKHITFIALTGVIIGLLLGLKGDKDEDESFAYNFLMYELASYYKEIVEPVPIYGWHSTTQQFLKSPFVGYKFVENAYKVLYGITVGLFIDDDKMIYKRGIYKGQSKTLVALQKMLPFIREYKKWVNLKSTMGIYNYYNPFI